jgi:hypothetical protein
MLHRSIADKECGFRVLNDWELLAVAGGSRIPQAKKKNEDNQAPLGGGEGENSGQSNHNQIGNSSSGGHFGCKVFGGIMGVAAGLGSFPGSVLLLGPGGPLLAGSLGVLMDAAAEEACLTTVNRSR